MIIRCEELQKVCTKILSAVDTNNLSIVTETLAIYTNKNFLYLAVTNSEYYIKIKLDIQNEVEFNATVAADLFLKLISKITTETVEFKIADNYLIIIGNGTYKLPMIYDGDELLKLPEISIENITSSFTVNNTILHSIINYNSRELLKKFVAANPVQNLYYIDNKGCITFTTGACVNQFSLPREAKFLLNDKIVKLFKLFTEDLVAVEYGNNTLADGIIQSKIRLKTDSTELTAIINSDDSLLANVPEALIRKRAFDNYDYSITINKKLLLDAIDRILLFTKTALAAYGKFTFSKDKIILSNEQGDNSEIIYYKEELNEDIDYTAIFDLADLKLVIGGIKSDYFTLSFGNGQAAVLIENNIYNIIPECII